MRIRQGRHRSLTYKRNRQMRRDSGANKPASLGGRILGACFFGIFLTAGLFFAVIMTREFTADASTRSWPGVHGELLQSDITIQEKDKDPFTLAAQYRYTVNGETYRGTTVQRSTPAYDDYRKAQKKLDALRSQNPLRVYYHPDHPETAVLQHASSWQFLMLLLPLIFILIGGGGIVGMLFYSGGNKDGKDKPISEEAAKSSTRGGFFFLIFAAFGFAFLPIFVQPIIHSLSSGNWPNIPCTILYSQLRSYSDSDGTTYKADILYEYTYEGRLYRSNKVEFMGGSSSGRSGKQQILKAHPKGSQQTCYVNPKDPTLAVLKRGGSPVYFFALIPLLFVIIGLSGFTKWLWNRHAPEKDGLHQKKVRHKERQSMMTAAGDVELKSKQHRITQFIFLLIFAIFWNGIVFGFLVREVVQSWQSGKGDIFLTLFSIPFVAVGIGVAIGAIVTFLKFFNPVLHLFINQPDVAPGEELTIRWQMRGGLKSVEELTIQFIGEEVTKYRRGTTTYTDRHTFHDQMLVEGGRFQDIDRGQTSLTLRPDAMHSFDQPNNKIIWTLKAHGTITFWPDVNIDYEVPVTPGRPAS